MRLLLAALITFSITVFARPLSPDEKAAEIRSLAAIVQSQYGPLEYKQLHLKIEMEKLVETYIAQSAVTTNIEFYYLINRFVAEFNDSHFGSSLNTNFISTLGFFTDRVGDKIVIDEIDREALPETKFPYRRGDEIVSLDGKAANEIVKDLSRYLGMGNPLSDLRYGSILLTTRAASTVPAPTGKAKLEIRRGNSTQLDAIELDWQTSGNPIWDDARTPATNYGLISIADLYDQLPQAEKSFRCSPKSRIEIPKDAKVIFMEPFVVYHWPTAKGNVGYLRIPHYNWKNAVTKADENDIRFRQYEYAIQELEQNTVGLVIDQDHNCGGAVKMVEKMVGLFIDKPFTGLEFQFLASRGEYLEFEKWKTAEIKSTIEGQNFQMVLELIKSTWEKGQSRLTEKTTFQAGKLLSPNHVRYSKPVLVLMDEMSGSGGDAFPGMMQGLGRAKLFGTRTMGAGGHVVDGFRLPYSGNNLRMTKSLFYHPNGTAIENNGATPDYPYTITMEDYLYGYREYRAKYTETLLSLIP
jgi:hypothetical protein